MITDVSKAIGKWLWCSGCLLLMSLWSPQVLAEPKIVLSQTEIAIVHKLQQVTDFDSSKAAQAMMSLFRYQSTVSDVIRARGLTDAQRRVQVKQARNDLVAELRPTMSANQIRKWLDYSLPELYRAPNLVQFDHNLLNSDWLGADWYLRSGVP